MFFAFRSVYWFSNCFGNKIIQISINYWSHYIMQNISPFDRVLSIGEILDRTFRLYRNKLGVLALTAAALLIPLGILNVIVVGSTMLDDLAGFGAVGSLPTSSSTIGEGLIGLLSILGAIAAAVTTLALTHQGSGLLHGKIPSLGESLGIGFRRFFGYMGDSSRAVLLRSLCLGNLFVGTLVCIGSRLHRSKYECG